MSEATEEVVSANDNALADAALMARMEQAAPGQRSWWPVLAMVLVSWAVFAFLAWGAWRIVTLAFFR